jgi:hypothetical protein
MSKKSILDIFPKVVTKLPEEYQKINKQHYISNREGKYKTSFLTQMMESWMHKKVAEDVAGKHLKLSTLEIGAGTLNQIQYEPFQDEYDIVEPFDELYENSPLRMNIRHVYKDIKDININKYDRITSIATFEHILDLPFVVAKAAQLLKDDVGHLRVAIPNEGTILWKLGTLVTGYDFKKKYGLDYQILMKYHHVNTADEIEDVLNYFFKNIKCSIFGISKSIGFYRFYDCNSPRFDKINAFLNK